MQWFNARKTPIFTGVSLGGVIIGAHFISRLVRQLRSGLFSPPGPCFKYSLFSRVIILLWITFCQACVNFSIIFPPHDVQMRTGGWSAAGVTS